jgi:O-antigen/teichoic acid export membrane protein
MKIASMSRVEASRDPDKVHLPNILQVSRGATYLVMQSIVTNVVTAASFVIVARLITPAEMGIWTVLTLASGFCQTFATLAIPWAATKYVAEHMARGEKGVAAAAFYQAMKLTFPFGLAFGLVMFFGAHALAVQLLGEPRHALLFQVLAFDTLISSGLLPVLGSVLLGLQKFRELAVVGVVMGSILRQLLIIGLLLLLRNFVGLVIAWTLSDVAAGSAYFLYAIRFLGPLRFDFPLRKLIGFSWPITLDQAASFAQTWYDRALLIAFVPLATLGIYNAVIVAFSVLTSISGAMASTLFPAYSAVQTHDRNQTLTDSVQRASRYVSFVAIPLAIGLLATSTPALSLLVGQAYVQGSEPLMILSGIFAVTVFGTVALSPVLLAIEETRWASAINIISVILSLGAALILLPIAGIIGASISRGVTMILVTAFTFLVVRKKMTLRLDLQAMVKSLIASAIMLAVVYTTQFLVYSKFLLPAYVLVGGVTYLAMLRLLRAARREDVDLVRRYFGHRLAFVPELMSKILLPKEKTAT